MDTERLSFSSRFLQGDFSHDGATFQEYALSRADLVIKTPSNIKDEEASTLSTSIITAFVILFNNTEFALPTSGPTASDIPIVILGGSGSIGRACKPILIIIRLPI